jgi:hypothetical protein
MAFPPIGYSKATNREELGPERLLLLLLLPQRPGTSISLLGLLLQRDRGNHTNQSCAAGIAAAAGASSTCLTTTIDKCATAQ